MFPKMLVFNAIRDVTATLYNVICGCCVLVTFMEMFARDNA